MKTSTFKNRVLPYVLSVAMILGNAGFAYAEPADSGEKASEAVEEQVMGETDTTPEDSATADEINSESNPDTDDPVYYTVHIDEEITDGTVLVAGQSEDIQAEADTVIYFSAEANEGYQTDSVLVKTKDQQEILTEALGSGEYSFIMPQSDVTVSASFSQAEADQEKEEAETKSEPEKEITLDVVEQVENSPALATVQNMTITMLGYQSYELAGYGSGYDAAFAIGAGQYEGNGNAFCLNPAVQAPGRDQMNQSVSYSVNVETYKDPMLLKIMYYGFGGPEDITGGYADNPPARHILTHMVATKRAAELGIPGAGDYTYRANATAIGLANSLYAAIASKQDVVGTVSVLTPVAGLQTIILLSSVGPKTGKLSLTKKSAAVEVTGGNPCYSLAGAVYGVYSDKACSKEVGRFTTGADGNATEELTLNAGSYYVKEISASKGYLLDETVYPANVSAGSTAHVDVLEQPGNDPVTILVEKKDAVTGESSERLKGAQFTVKYYPVENEGDLADTEPSATWIFETNEKGIIRLADSYKVSGDSLYTGETGAPVLPLGFITIQETKAPAGYKLNNTVYVCQTTKSNDVVVTENLPTGENAVRENPFQPAIHTTALSELTGTHTAVSSSKETLIDTVAYEELIVGREYTVKGQLIDVETDKVLASNEVVFKADKSKGTVDLSVSVDTTKLEGKALVFFEELYEGSEKKAEHKDKNDENQRIYVPQIHTTALDQESRTHSVKPEAQVTVIDTVSYTGLTPGKTYTVTGYLMDKTSGQELLVDGEKVTNSKEFTAENAAGTVELAFTFDASHLIGKAIVVFEGLSYEGNELCVHADINDQSQTVEISENPAIGTTAKDGSTDSNVGTVSDQAVIVDTVHYSGLTPEKEYDIQGILMDKTTGEELLINEEKVTAKAHFKAEDQTGSVDVEFAFDASDMGGKVVVVFETLLDADGKEIAEHKDMSDDFQTITYPEIRTTAADGQTGSHTGTVGTTTIVDIVNYKGLIPGKAYTVSGVLMNKATGEPLLVQGAQIETETDFVAMTCDGSVELTYELDASALAGTTVVVFESLKHKGVEVYSHADISDEDQSIHYPEIHTTASVNGAKETKPSKKTTLVDTVTYSNLVPGEAYTVSGILMDKATGKELLVDGKSVTASAEFVPENADGSVEVTFTFDSTEIGDFTTVVFETLKKGGVEVTAHADLNDEDQTVVFKTEKGTITTSKKTLTTSPKTGDTAPAVEYVLLFAVALAALAAIAFVRRKKS